MTDSPAPSPSVTNRAALWLPLAAAIVLLSVLWRPAHDSDLFWQLRTGDLILDAGQLPEHEPFLANKADEPFAPVAWLGQVVYALLRRVGGWPLVHIVDGLLWTAALVAVGWSLRLAGASAWVVAAAIVFANYTMYSSVSTRPQTFGLLGFAVIVALVRWNLSLRTTLLIGAGVLVAWQNLHPSVAVGAMYLGVIALVGWVRRLLRRGPVPWAATGLACLAPIAMLATPAGLTTIEITSRNTDISRWLEINEWMPLWELEARDDSRPEVWVGFAVSIALLVWRGRRVRVEDLAVALVFAGLALFSYRFVMFWAVATIPVWVACGSSEPDASATKAPRPSLTLPALIGAFIVAIAIPTIRNPSHFADYVPHTAIDRLHAENVRGTIYTHSVWAGVVIDRGYPDWKVTHDGRYYLRTKDEWSHYHAAAVGLVPIAELEARWAPVAFVLRTKFDDGLIELLRQDRVGWKELAPEKDCVVFVRTPPR